MTTTTASASCTENIRLVREMLKTVKPNDLTDDEIVAMVEILRAAADRKQETQPGVSARHLLPWWRAELLV